MSKCEEFDNCLCEPKDCWQCGGEGGWSLYEEDPLWYDKDDWRNCDICEGKGCYIICEKELKPVKE